MRRILRIGALAPLTSPGWVDAGRQLVAGMALACDDANGGDLGASPAIELLTRDTAGDPGRAEAAVDELSAIGVEALAGEYHSVCARAAAARADAIGLPFLCSSAVVDELVGHPSSSVARLSPPQSRGWRVFAHHLLDQGHRRICAAIAPGAYWTAGLRILETSIEQAGGVLLPLDADSSPREVVSRVAEAGATTLLLLAGMPHPATDLAGAVRQDARTAGILIAAPAGQPELRGWSAALGQDGRGIPFLRYMPDELTPAGRRVERRLAERLGGTPSFVALEGYDSITVLAAALRGTAIEGPQRSVDWGAVDVEGTRGRIRFGRTAGVDVMQWLTAPVQVVDLSPAGAEVRVLRSASESAGG